MEGSEEVRRRDSDTIRTYNMINGAHQVSYEDVARWIRLQFVGHMFVMC